MEPHSALPIAPAEDDRKRVLVVEDDFIIRMLLSEELREAGYQVIEASSADEGLLALTCFTPDAIITDVRMPGSVDGLGMLAVVRESFPTLPVIVTSGHLYALLTADEATLFVPKPYLIQSILDVVRVRLAEDL